MQSNQRRLFFAFWPTGPVRRQIVDRCRPAVDDSAGRAVAAYNLHLTLAFLGSVSEARVAPIIAAVAECKFPCFEMSLSRIGYWYRSRVLWLAPDTDDAVAATALVAGTVFSALAPLGYAAERRPFRPHVTLARKARPVAASRIEPVRWQIADLVLVESLTGPARAEYRIVHRYVATRT